MILFIYYHRRRGVYARNLSCRLVRTFDLFTIICTYIGRLRVVKNMCHRESEYIGLTNREHRNIKFVRTMKHTRFISESPSITDNRRNRQLRIKIR